MNLLLALAAPLGPASPPTRAAQTTVELRVGREAGPGAGAPDPGPGAPPPAAIRRRLADRLLEDGYRLVPEGSAADVRVRVAWGPGGAAVEADGADRRRATIAAADLEVALLELQQVASALVEEVRPARAGGAAAVAIELTGDDADPGLRERLQAELLGRGLSVTRAPAPGDRRLCVDEDPAALRYQAIAGDARCDRADAMVAVAGASPEARRERLIAEASAALTAPAEVAHDADAGAAEPSNPPINNVQEGLAAPAPAAAATAPARPPAALSVALSVHGGVAARSDAPDGLVRVELRLGRRRGLGGAIDLGLIPSRGPDLRVLDVAPTAALDWRLGFGQRGLVTLGAYAGAHVHTWRDADGPGHRVGPSVGASAGFGALGRRGALVFGGLRAGYAGGNAVHVVNGAAIWRRAPLLVALTLGVGWDLAWRPRR